MARRNKYAALAAARQGDWAAVMQLDNLDLLDERMLRQVLQQVYQHSDRGPEQQNAISVLRDEIRRCAIDAAHAQEMGR